MNYIVKCLVIIMLFFIFLKAQIFLSYFPNEDPRFYSNKALK